MDFFKLNHAEYTNIIRTCARHTDDYPGEGTLNLLLDLLHVRFDQQNLYFEVPKRLMKQVAILNMCDMSLLQLRDTYGEIDYAMLGNYSELILESILNTIDNI